MTALLDQPVESLRSYRGTMTMRIVDMTPAEREAYYKTAALDVRERLFAIGQPLVYEKDGTIVAEHANGNLETVR